MWQRAAIQARVSNRRSLPIRGRQGSAPGATDELGLLECLGQIADEHPAIAALDFDALVARAIAQYDLKQQ
jgi:hypothetical protein